MDDLDELKKIYLSEDVDSDDYKDNLAQINEWQRQLLESEGMQSWQSHDVTKKIIIQAEESYVAHTLSLANNRDLTEAQRQSLWAKQDACLWIISLASEDAKNTLKDIKKKVRIAINATK